MAKQLGARRYLEIGVAEGNTFRDVEIAERTAVDPHFRFDTNELANEFTRFVKDTSDGFFAAEPLSPPYDIVYIDGLHTFEQVVRDISNTLLRTHRRSVVVLDDTVPSDVYSALWDQESANRYRTAALGGTTYAWHGDVYKAVFYIHDFWPSLNYRTITDAGNPQTLVWRAVGGNRQPLFNNLERISRLNYFDLQEHFGVMQTATDDETIALCVAETQAL
ncbi:MAG TPA: class I SAM-dependent methyltransferase [Candidatus Binataceae bacterium]|nr:class I SAM-dependent methyltransferase [Candidatus Binataceae bacterium]